MMNNGITTEASTVKARAKKLLSVTDKNGKIYSRLTHLPYKYVCLTHVPSLAGKFWNGKIQSGIFDSWHISLKNAKPPYYQKGCKFDIIEIA